MLFKRFISKMQQSSKNFGAKFFPSSKNEDSNLDYQNAIRTLNGLQSNAHYIKIAGRDNLSHEEIYAKTILQAQNYLIRSGVPLETLDTLSVIHVTGTKGKGSTCALCESILRHHGLRTGFYSSPHLLEVRERIRINGVPLKKPLFAEHFWQLYDKLLKEQAHSKDMPMYFMFLTLLALRVFLKEKVDVAIIEVGIGGEYDSTNILRQVPVVGITSLSLDHTTMLGNTIEKIAWHKAGIMKPGGQAFTVHQPSTAMKILKERSIERKCSLQKIESLRNLLFVENNFDLGSIYELNAGLAVHLAQAWFKEKQLKPLNPEATKLGLLNYNWPGRFQILHLSNNFYYLDGAHTAESMTFCAQWFLSNTKKSKRRKVLIFNATGDRDSKQLMKELLPCSFERVYLVPNTATRSDREDNKNYNLGYDKQLQNCYTNCRLWLELQENRNEITQSVKVLQVVLDALQECENHENDILITGSLHLVGATLSIINSDMNDGD